MSYSINWSAMANNQVLIYFEYPVSEDVEIESTEAVEGAIEAEDLPWQFNPNDTKIGKLSVIEVPVTACNIMTSTYKLVNNYARCTPKSDGTYAATSQADIGTTVVTAESAISPLSADTLKKMWHIHTTGGGDFSSAGSPFGFSTALKNKLVLNVDTVNSIKSSLGLSDYSGTEDLANYNDSVIHYANRYYRITVSSKVSTDVTKKISRLNQDINDGFDAFVYDYNTRYGTSTVRLNKPDANTLLGVADINLKLYIDTYDISVSEITVEDALKVTIPADDMRTHLVDAPYDMFCMPYKAIQLADGTYTSPDACLQIAFEMAKDLGTSKIYDIQLLPYCPVRRYISGRNRVVETSGVENVDYTYIKAGLNKKVGIIFFASESNLTFDINRQISIQDYVEDEALKLKISNECDLYRLVSPNYSGQFEFSVAKNGGTVEKFNVDLTYKPYNPYIHINPEFAGLYGIDYNDARGLLLGGDFSLPIISDA